MFRKTERNIEKSTIDKQNKKISNHKHVRAKIISWASISSSKHHVDNVGKNIEEHRKIKGWTAKKTKASNKDNESFSEKRDTKATKHVISKIISWASISSSKHHVDIVGKHIEGQRKANSWRGKQRKFRSRLAKLIRNCECKIHKKSAQITRWASTSSSKYKVDKVEEDREEHRKINDWQAKQKKTSNHNHVRAKTISWASISSSKHRVDIVGKDIEEHRKIKGWTAKKNENFE